MEDLWPTIDNYPVEKNDSINILREQARAIEAKTKKRIKATFSLIKRLKIEQPLIKSIKAMEQLSRELYEDTDDDLFERKDANDLFVKKYYRFEIFNEEYRFRLFVFHYSELYPVEIDVDEGILQEITYQNLSHINSNDELCNVLKEIFSCKKVMTIISRMLGGEKTNYNNSELH